MNEFTFSQEEATDILLDLKERRTFYFDELTQEEKAVLNHKELIEDDYFIMVSHHNSEIQEKIDDLCPLNFFVNENFQLVAYNEDNAQRCEILPGDTYLKVNNI